MDREIASAETLSLLAAGGTNVVEAAGADVGHDREDLRIQIGRAHV